MNDLFKCEIFDGVRHGMSSYSGSLHYLLYNVGSSVRIKSFSDDYGFILAQYEKLKESIESLRVVSFYYHIKQDLL